MTTTDPHREPATGEMAVSVALEAQAQATAAATRRARTWDVLGHRDYALLFWGQLISAAGTQMQVVAVAWQVLLLTNSPSRWA